MPQEPLSYASPDTPRHARTSALPKIVGWGLAIISLVGIGLWWAADEALNRFSVIVTIDNQTASPIQRVKFSFDGHTVAFDNIPANASLQRAVKLRGRGALLYTVDSASNQYPTANAASYLDADCEGYRVGLRFNRDGTVTQF